MRDRTGQTPRMPISLPACKYAKQQDCKGDFVPMQSVYVELVVTSSFYTKQLAGETAKSKEGKGGAGEPKGPKKIAEYSPSG